MDPEVVAKPTRQPFTAEHKLGILQATGQCSEPGRVGRRQRPSNGHGHAGEWPLRSLRRAAPKVSHCCLKRYAAALT